MTRFFLLPVILLLCACDTKTKNEKVSLSEKFLLKFKEIKGDSIYVNISYDLQDSLKRLDRAEYAFFGSSFKESIEPNELAYLAKFSISNKKEGLILTNSAAGAYLSAYLFVWNNDSLKAEYIEEVGAFYELHNSGSYINTWIIKSASQLQLKKKVRHCNFRNDPENGECKDSVSATVINL